MPVHYLAYGSNLHPRRLTERVTSAQLVGIARVPGMKLVFSKRSEDGSAKCMFEETESPADALFGAVYRMDAGDKPVLDAIEGVGQGYDERRMSVDVEGARIDAFTYAASATHVAPGLRPYHWYRELVLLGAQYLRLPGNYIAGIATTPSIPDPDEDRARSKDCLLAAMREINRRGERQEY